MTHYVMDYETMINCFVAVFEHYKENTTKTFVIHKSRNDIKQLIDFLNNNAINNQWHISFNGLTFDSQITHYLLLNQEALYNETNGQSIANWLYEYAQYIIDKKNETGFAEFSENQLFIKQIDLFKLNHWDNPAKSSSLKWIQYTSDWYNIQEMPIHHSTWIDEKQIPEIIDYCINDVTSTKHILHSSTELIRLRKVLTEEYNINLYSASEPRISKELFLHFLSKKTGVAKHELKKQRTYRTNIKVNDIILDYVKFETPTFKELLSNFRKVEIDPNNTKGGFKTTIQYKNVRTDFGLGGLHGATEKGIYRSNERMVIMTSDVVSYYPNLAIKNNWSPAHIKKEDFCNLYEWFFDERKKIPKKDPKNYVYKIILNSTYGLSNDKDSFLYDPEFTMRITINGQLSLCMLYEMISERIPQAIPLMQNTDGLETMIPVKYIDTYYQICKEWEEITKLSLEHDQYSKMIIADVNNYIAVFKEQEVSEKEYNTYKVSDPHFVFREDNNKFYVTKTKCKGRFEFYNLALHKNKSGLVIPKMIYNYFIKDIHPIDYIETNNNLFDYCFGVKSKGDWVIQDQSHKSYQKIVRFYVTTENNCRLLKVNKVDGRVIFVIANAMYRQTVLNNIDPGKEFKSYPINKQFYIEKAISEISNIVSTFLENQQLKIF